MWRFDDPLRLVEEGAEQRGVMLQRHRVSPRTLRTRLLRGGPVHDTQLTQAQIQLDVALRAAQALDGIADFGATVRLCAIATTRERRRATSRGRPPYEATKPEDLCRQACRPPASCLFLLLGALAGVAMSGLCSGCQHKVRRQDRACQKSGNGVVPKNGQGSDADHTSCVAISL